MEIFRYISVADWLIILGTTALILRVYFFLLLRKRHNDIWEKLNASSGELPFSKKSFDLINKFLDKKEFRKIDGPKVKFVGEITNVLTTIFMWSFGIFLFYLFVWPFIKVIS